MNSIKKNSINASKIFRFGVNFLLGKEEKTAYFFLFLYAISLRSAYIAKNPPFPLYLPRLFGYTSNKERSELADKNAPKAQMTIISLLRRHGVKRNG